MSEGYEGITPGPWFVSAEVERDEGPVLYHLDSRNDGPVGYFESLGDAVPEDRAGVYDARLIAAAPDLLAERDALLGEVEKLRGELRQIATEVLTRDAQGQPAVVIGHEGQATPAALRAQDLLSPSPDKTNEVGETMAQAWDRLHAEGRLDTSTFDTERERR